MNKPIKFGVGQAVTRKEDDRAPARHRPLCRRPRARQRVACGRAALAACACALSHGCDEGAEHARRAPPADGGRYRRARTHAVRGHTAGRRRPGADLSGAGARGGTPCRRCHRFRRRADARPGARCGGGDRAQLGAAAAGDRRGRRAQAGRAAGLAGPPRQSRIRDDAGRRGRDQAGVRAGRAHRLAYGRQPAPRHQLSRHPRRRRRIRCDGRSHHTDDREPGQPRGPRHHLRPRAQDRAATGCGW